MSGLISDEMVHHAIIAAGAHRLHGDRVAQIRAALEAIEPMLGNLIGDAQASEYQIGYRSGFGARASMEGCCSNCEAETFACTACGARVEP